MKANGIVVEYNPFHNGHLLHLKEAKKNGNIIIAVMSGNFTQRGEPAIFNKWIRTEMALKHGVDLVMELPIFYSTQSAELFAHGAIDILEKLGVECLIFGSESKNLHRLKKIVHIQIEEKELLNEKLKENINSGISYPNAMSLVMKKLLGEEFVLKSNDILGVEYLKAIKKLKSNILPISIKRKFAEYNEKKIVNGIASATAIREMIKEKELEKTEHTMPQKSYELIETPTYLEKFYSLIRYEILNNYKDLVGIMDMEIGLENRIYKMAIKYSDYNEFYNNLMTKRYSSGRIQRILIHILLKIDKNIIEKNRDGINYVKILGFSNKGREYIKKNRSKFKIKILSGLKNVNLILDEHEKQLLDFELKCDRIYQIINPYEDHKMPIYIENIYK